MDEIFLTLCRHSVKLRDGYSPFSSTDIAQACGEKIGRVRYRLQQLKSKGLVATRIEGWRAEDGTVRNSRGYYVTRWGMATTEFITAVYDEQYELEIRHGAAMSDYARKMLHPKPVFNTENVDTTEKKIYEIEAKLGYISQQPRRWINADELISRLRKYQISLKMPGQCEADETIELCIDLINGLLKKGTDR